MGKTTFIAAGVAMTLFLAGCGKEKEKEAEPVRPVQLIEVQRGSIPRIITADGILRALDQSAITPKLSAPVSKFFVNRGDHVKKGQLLAVLENRDLAASVEDAKGAYEQASAALRNTSAASVPDELTKAQADVQAAKQTMEAAQKLLQSREQLFRDGALARRLVDEAAVTYAQAKSQYDTSLRHLESVQSVSRHEEVKGAQGQANSAKGKYEAAQAQLSYSEIRSPIDGVIADRAIFPGEMASAGTPLLTVMDVSSVIARVSVPQAQAAYVKVGQPARIASSDGLVQVAGKVTVVSPAVDPQATTVEVWAQAANTGEKLRPGGTVHVTITADTIRNAIVVPPAALLQSSEGGTAVIVVGADMIAHEHKVQVGVRTADKAQILEGVEPGAKIVVAGGLGLEDGARVRLQEAADNNEKKDDDKEKK
ncbi:MAG: efflux RND transporter periplasmic adaptor subunit [Acidobacteria bacterium]|nr:MAG: efflux RND transporter periplasmic adaptor subunit [Acidobacteriota bacterium]